MSDVDEEEELAVEEAAPVTPAKSPWKKGEYVSPADEFAEMEKELSRLIASPKTADFVGRRPHGTGAGALQNGPGGYLGDATDEMELGFFVVPGFEKKDALGPKIPAHGGKRLQMRNNHPNREWDRDLCLKMATTGMFRPPPGERSPVKSGPGARAATLDLGGRTEYANLQMYPESVYLADNKDYTTAMRRVNARKWTKETAQEVEEESKRLQHEFDQAMLGGYQLPRVRDKLLRS